MYNYETFLLLTIEIMAYKNYLKRSNVAKNVSTGGQNLTKYKSENVENWKIDTFSF